MIECVCIDVDEWPEFSCAKTVRARKAHTCGECGKQIQPGDRHEIAKGKWNGEFSQHRTCTFCVNIRDLFFSCGYHFGMIYEDLLDRFGDDMRYMFDGY